MCVTRSEQCVFNCITVDVLVFSKHILIVELFSRNFFIPPAMRTCVGCTCLEFSVGLNVTTDNLNK